MNSLSRISLFSGAISAVIAVIAGAFGAHGLKQILAPEMLAIFETAVRFQMYHAFALIATGIIANQSKPETQTLLRLASSLFAAGTLLFSGSLYMLVLANAKWLGMITPIGGICLILGWIMLAIAVWNSRK